MGSASDFLASSITKTTKAKVSIPVGAGSAAAFLSAKSTPIAGGGGSAAEFLTNQANSKLQGQYNSLVKKSSPSAVSKVLHAGGSLVGKALNVLDLPRAAIVSSIGHATGQIDTGRSVGYDITHHVGVGQLKAVKNLDNKWAQRAIGFVGDTALDPTTYLTLGASEVDAAGRAGKAVTKQAVVKDLAQSGVQKFGADEAARLASEVSKKGLTALPAADQASLGVKGALKFGTKNHNIQGFEGAARTVAKAGVAVKGLPVARTIDKGITGLFQPDVVKATTEALGSKNVTPLKIAAMSGVTKAAAQDGKIVSHQATESLKQLVDAHKGVDWKAVNTALQSESLPAAERLAVAGGDQKVIAAADDMRKWYDTTHQAMIDSTGANLGLRAEYSPWQFSAELKKLQEGIKAKPNGRAGALPFEKQAGLLQPNAKFMGKPIIGKTAAEKQASAEAIAREAFGSDAVKVFQDDALALAKGYLNGVDRFVSQNAIQKHIALSDVLSKDANLAATQSADNRALAGQLKQTATEQLNLGNSHAAEAAQVAAQSHLDLANAIESGVKIPTEAQVSKALPINHASIQNLGQDALAAFIKGRESEPWVADAVNRFQEAMRPGNPNSITKMYDKVTNLWKGYALLSPGFHFRNYMGGMFNNSLAGVGLKDYTLFEKLNAAKEIPPQYKKLWDEWQKVHVIGEHSIRDVGDVGNTISKGSKLNPASGNFALVNKNFKFAGKVEDHLRGPLFVHEFMTNGGDAQKALDAINLYHFDYQDLNAFERGTAKRVIPFFTWSRKNFPLQIENMIRQPGKYTRWLHVQQNAGLGTPDDPNMPAYLKSLLAIRTPFTQGPGFLPTSGDGGSRIYATPDLPFRDLSETLNPLSALAQINPFIKTPIELGLNTQFFQQKPFNESYQPVPGIIKEALKVPGLGNGLAILAKAPLLGGAVPKIRKDSNGQWVAKERDIYKLEQTLPLLGRMKRLVPNDPKNQSRIFSNWASFALGLSTTTNDAAAQSGELSRRIKALQKINSANKTFTGTN